MQNANSCLEYASRLDFFQLNSLIRDLQAIAQQRYQAELDRQNALYKQEEAQYKQEKARYKQEEQARQKKEQEKISDQLYRASVTGFEYTVSTKGEGHSIGYSPKGDMLLESVRAYAPDNRFTKYSILHKVFRVGSDQSPIFSRKNPIPEEVLQVIYTIEHRPDFDIRNLRLL